MQQWNLVCRMRTSVGSAIPVVSMDIRHQSVGVVVKHHTQTDACSTSRLHQDKISHKKKVKSPVLNYAECSKLFIKCFG